MSVNLELIPLSYQKFSSGDLGVCLKEALTDTRTPPKIIENFPKNSVNSKPFNLTDAEENNINDLSNRILKKSQKFQYIWGAVNAIDDTNKSHAHVAILGESPQDFKNRPTLHDGRLSLADFNPTNIAIIHMDMNSQVAPLSLLLFTDVKLNKKTGIVEIKKTDGNLFDHIKKRMVNPTDEDVRKKESEMEHILIQVAYSLLKELYHKHTHHSDDKNRADCLLKCVKGTFDEALIGILNQFRKNIVYYNQIISEMKHAKCQPTVDLGKIATGVFSFGNMYVRIFRNEFVKMNVDVEEERHDFNAATKSIGYIVNQKIASQEVKHSVAMRYTAILAMMITVTTLILVNSTSIAEMFNLEIKLVGYIALILDFIFFFLLFLVNKTNIVTKRY